MLESLSRQRQAAESDLNKGLEECFGVSSYHEITPIIVLQRDQNKKWFIYPTQAQQGSSGDIVKVLNDQKEIQFTRGKRNQERWIFIHTEEQNGWNFDKSEALKIIDSSSIFSDFGVFGKFKTPGLTRVYDMGKISDEYTFASNHLYVIDFFDNITNHELATFRAAEWLVDKVKKGIAIAGIKPRKE